MNSELNKTIEESLGLLGKVLAESNASKRELDYRKAFIYRHTYSTYRLGHDVIFLLKANRLDSCPIIVRAMLESLFKLVAAVKKPETAVQIIISEVEDEIERTKKCFDPITAAPIIESLSNFKEKLRIEHGVISKKNWNVFECADEAELGQMYSGEYFAFSKHAHATTSGILLREGKVGAGHALQTILKIVLFAASSFIQAIKTSSPKSHLNEIVRLKNEFLKLDDDDVFCKMDRPKDGSHPTG
jgi:hypothetical protein